MDEIDSLELWGDLFFMDYVNDFNWIGDLIGGLVNGSENL